MPRLFLAVRAPTAAPISALIAKLQEVRGVSAVPPENVHFTLRFLGDVSHEQKAALIHLLDGAQVEEPRFEVNVQGTGTFPGGPRARVVWLGVDAEAAVRLGRLADAVDGFADELGLGPRDKPFKPHLTVARVKRPDGRGSSDLQALVESHRDRAFATFTVDRVTLIESQLDPQGARYTDLLEVPLR